MGKVIGSLTDPLLLVPDRYASSVRCRRMIPSHHLIRFHPSTPYRPILYCQELSQIHLECFHLTQGLFPEVPLPSVLVSSSRDDLPPWVLMVLGHGGDFDS